MGVFGEREMYEGLLAVRVADDDGQCVVALEGEMDLSNSSLAEAALREAMAEGFRRVVVDMRELVHRLHRYRPARSSAPGEWRGRPVSVRAQSVSGRDVGPAADRARPETHPGGPVLVGPLAADSDPGWGYAILAGCRRTKRAT